MALMSKRGLTLLVVLSLVATVGIFAPAPVEAGRVAGGIYWPLPGDPAHGYIYYVRPMPGPGIEVYLTARGISYGLSEIGSIRLSIWTLKGYYQAGGSRSDFPYNVTYVQSIANEIRLHCLYFWVEGANPINIERDDHPGYQVSRWQALRDWLF